MARFGVSLWFSVGIAGFAYASGLLQPQASEVEARAIAVQTVESIHVNSSPVVGWRVDDSRYDVTGVISKANGKVVKNCLGGMLPALPESVCVADPVWRFHFVAPPQNGFSLESAIAVDARTRRVVGECDAAWRVNATLAAAVGRCGLSQPFGDAS